MKKIWNILLILIGAYNLYLTYNSIVQHRADGLIAFNAIAGIFCIVLGLYAIFRKK